MKTYRAISFLLTSHPVPDHWFSGRSHLYLQRNQTSQAFKEYWMSLAEGSLPFLSLKCFPDFLFLSLFKHHPSPDCVISFLDNCNGY